jgi:hypothetical protein
MVGVQAQAHGVAGAGAWGCRRRRMGLQAQAQLGHFGSQPRAKGGGRREGAAFWVGAALWEILWEILWERSSVRVRVRVRVGVRGGALWEMSTPLGLPVVPEVYMSTAALVVSTWVCAAGALAPSALRASIRWILMPAAASCLAASADLDACGGQPLRRGLPQEASQPGEQSRGTTSRRRREQPLAGTAGCGLACGRTVR